MNVFELTPGYYKIRKKQYQDGRKHVNNNTIHLLRVEGAGEKLKYLIDHDLIGFNPKNDEGWNEYEVISKLNGPPHKSKTAK